MSVNRRAPLPVAVGLIALAFVMLITACQPKKTDPSVRYTQAAETIAVQLTKMNLPSPEPTMQRLELKSPTPAQATLTQAPTLALPTAAAPAATATSGAQAADRAQYISQNPVDDSTLLPGQPFQMIWTVKNLGPTTWTTAYQIRFYAGNPSGNNFTSPSALAIPKEVKPDEQVDLVLNLVAPASNGTYEGIWAITNADGINFQGLTLRVKVAGPTATPSMTPTATVDAAAQTATAVYCAANPAACPAP